MVIERAVPAQTENAKGSCSRGGRDVMGCIWEVSHFRDLFNESRMSNARNCNAIDVNCWRRNCDLDIGLTVARRRLDAKSQCVSANRLSPLMERSWSTAYRSRPVLVVGRGWTLPFTTQCGDFESRKDTNPMSTNLMRPNSPTTASPVSTILPGL